MDWHPFSGPGGAFVVGVVCGAWIATVAFGLSLIYESRKAQKR